MEVKLPSIPDRVAEWIQANARSRMQKIRIRAIADVICNSASGHVDTWWGQITWETSLNDYETKIEMSS